MVEEFKQNKMLLFRVLQQHEMFAILCNMIAVHVIAYAYSKKNSLAQLYRKILEQKEYLYN